MTTPIVWSNGTLRAPDEPLVTALDHGLTVGDGAFETLTVRDGRVFALERHLARLKYSAQRLGLALPDPAHVREGIAAVMAAGDVTRLRVTVTSGPGPMGYVRGDGPLTVIVTGGYGSRPHVCHAVRSPWLRNERSALAGIKTTSYAENAVITAYARSRNADEAILSNTQGNLCEGTGSNVFVERDGEILTPPLASGCLAGVTRGLALEWGAAASIPVRVAAPGELTTSDLDHVIANRAHLAVSSSTRGVQHVSSLDGHALASGPLLAQLSAVFESNAQKNPDPPAPRSR